MLIEDSIREGLKIAGIALFVLVAVVAGNALLAHLFPHVPLFGGKAIF
jgi:hypothetical protein